MITVKSALMRVSIISHNSVLNLNDNFFIKKVGEESKSRKNF